MRGRGSAGAGRPARLPDGTYEPPPVVVQTPAGLIVNFIGEDGRTHSFDVGALPLEAWHEGLAASWAVRTGPSGGLRTLVSAKSGWGALSRMIRYLAQLPHPPLQPGQLAAKHIDSYRLHRESTQRADRARAELQSLALTFEIKPLSDLVSSEVRERMRSKVRMSRTPLSGYSDGELARIVSTARNEVVALRDRLDGHETADDDSDWVRLNYETLRTGRVPLRGLGAVQLVSARRQVAEKLFVTKQDIIAMLVLLVATTGWNVEVMKELPSEHRVIEGLAVELEVTKRRRGAGNWLETVTWEIGPPDRELYTPGGVYLLFHRLMASARKLLGEPSFWAVWHSGHPEGCRNPFGAGLNADLILKQWTEAHHLCADEPADAAEDLGREKRTESPPLRLNFNRLKTSIDVRRTRQMGGHLPSSARTNTVDVLFKNYLSGDQTTIEWAQSLVEETLVGVEQAAWTSHRQALAASGRRTLRIIPALKGEHSPVPPVAGFTPDSASTELDTAWAACSDHEHHPLTGRRCAVSFLDCFHCGNCLITSQHLPGLMGLLDALEGRRQQISEESWWKRYGPTWAAIRYEVLPKFSEAEISQAQENKPRDSMLDLVEPAWERP